MVPYILIGVFAIIGSLLFRIPGLVLGGVLGYVIAFVIGKRSTKKVGGLVPLEIKREVALQMVEKHPKDTRSMLEISDLSDQVLEIYNQIELIYKYSFDHYSHKQMYWTSREALKKATKAVIEEDPTVVKTRFYWELTKIILDVSYPAKTH